MLRWGNKLICLRRAQKQRSLPLLYRTLYFFTAKARRALSFLKVFFALFAGIAVQIFHLYDSKCFECYFTVNQTPASTTSNPITRVPSNDLTVAPSRP